MVPTGRSTASRQGSTTRCSTWVRIGARPVRLLDSSGGEVVDRAGALAARRPGRHRHRVRPRVPDEVDESLAILGYAGGARARRLVQAEELHSKRSEARFQQLVRNSSDAILIVDRDGRIRYQTPSVVRVLGFLTDGPRRRARSSSSSTRRRGPPRRASSTSCSTRRASRSAPPTCSSCGPTTRSSTPRSSAPTSSTRPTSGGVVLTIRDVTGRRTLEDQLRHQAFHDSLTGSAQPGAVHRPRRPRPRPRAPRRRPPPGGRRSSTSTTSRPSTTASGHGAGDELLGVGRRPAPRVPALRRHAGPPLRRRVRHPPRGHARRRGRGRGGRAGARRAPGAGDRRGRRGLREGEHRRRHPAGPGHDVRRAAAQRRPRDVHREGERQGLRRAVRAVACTTGPSTAWRSRATCERAVDAGELDVAYQPIVRLETGRVIGFEALARWNHPVRGPVSPVEFIPIAEDTGLILAARPLRARSRRAASWREWRAATPAPNWKMSVNLSARQLLAPDLVPMVREAPADAGLDPTALDRSSSPSRCCSPTASACCAGSTTSRSSASRSPSTTSAPGYSSLSYLQRVPFDILKIDRGVRVRPARRRTRDHARPDDHGSRPARSGAGDRRGRRAADRARRPPSSSAASSGRATTSGERLIHVDRADPPDALGHGLRPHCRAAVRSGACPRPPRTLSAARASSSARGSSSPRTATSWPTSPSLSATRSMLSSPEPTLRRSAPHGCRGGGDRRRRGPRSTVRT